MNLDLLKPLKGCRLEAVRVSKGSYTLELEKSENGNRSVFELSTNGYVLDLARGELEIGDGAKFLALCLELDLDQIDVLAADEALKLSFSNGEQVVLSSKGICADNIAIVKDKLSADWFLVS
ncbi:hypothetical protein [Hyphomonas sp.]|uniref:hypothetical protein n=1 Tax=Hyphomonas sp. TaxID=87 RepID=UPI000E08278B|nr:hypothetical protein [Hyphomonas sp.]RCL89476.1 MAG: hypothetical protein DBW63_01860 [Hyphomonas sp.]